jgi:hypothetical protein
MENQITCPKCGAKIDVSKVLYTQIEQSIRENYERDYKQKEVSFNQMKAQFEIERQNFELQKNKIIQEEIDKRLSDEKLILEKTLKDKIYAENKQIIEALQKDIEEQSRKVAELNRALIEVERLKREKSELEQKLKLDFERQLNELLRREQENLMKTFEDKYDLKMKEYEKIISDLNKKLEDAQRSALQGSMQLQGEIQELELERILREMFPFDDVRQVKKGQRGADVVQIVRNEFGRTCGKILYESKRTKNFDKNWISKLKEDNLEEKADVLVIVTQAMPDGTENYFFEDGVWICHFSDIYAFAKVLRLLVLEIYKVASFNENRGTKMELIYQYLTSNEFAQTFESIIKGFVELKQSYEEEKLKMQKIWKEREKQFERIITSATNFYGSIKGLAGSNIPDIKLLSD